MTLDEMYKEAKERTSYQVRAAGVDYNVGGASEKLLFWHIKHRGRTAKNYSSRIIPHIHEMYKECLAYVAASAIELLTRENLYDIRKSHDQLLPPSMLYRNGEGEGEDDDD